MGVLERRRLGGLLRGNTMQQAGSTTQLLWHVDDF